MNIITNTSKTELKSNKKLSQNEVHKKVVPTTTGWWRGKRKAHIGLHAGSALLGGVWWALIYLKTIETCNQCPKKGEKCSQRYPNGGLKGAKRMPKGNQGGAKWNQGNQRKI